MRRLQIAVALLLAAIYLFAGAGKLLDAPIMQTQFRAFGLPLWFMKVTGAVEITGALSLMAPVALVRAIGAMALAVTMIVGAGFHFAFDPLAAALPALLLAGVAAWFAQAAIKSHQHKGARDD